MTPKCRAAEAVRVWHRVSTLLRLAIVAGVAVAAVVLYVVGTSVVQLIVRMHGG